MTITHKAGELIQLTSGDYSDYTLGPLLRVLVDLDLPAEAEAYFKARPVNVHGSQIDVGTSGFAAHMIITGAVEELEAHEVNIDTYGPSFLGCVAEACAARRIADRITEVVARAVPNPPAEVDLGHDWISDGSLDKCRRCGCSVANFENWPGKLGGRYSEPCRGGR